MVTDNRPEKKWLGVYFSCCNIYARIYLNEKLKAYTGNCPICRKAVRVGISDKGTKQRIFTTDL